MLVRIVNRSATSIAGDMSLLANESGSFGKVCHNDGIVLMNNKVLTMATMNVSLPEQMKSWVEQQTVTGRFSNASDYVRDLIRRDQEQAVKIAHLQQLVTEGIASGPGARTMQQLEQAALAKLAR